MSCAYFWYYEYRPRMMMPDLGRWGVMDAISEKYSSLSPYNYAINNPVMVIDPDGNDAMFASGEAAQFAFRAFVATMSTSTETSGGNIFTGFGGRSFGEDPKPGFWGSIGNFFRSLFGTNKSRVEVGPAERITAEDYSASGSRLFGLIQGANYNPMTEYRTRRDNPFYNEEESSLDRSFRLMNSSHIEIMQDFGGGGYNMFGGYGRVARAAGAANIAEEISASRVAKVAETQGFKSLNSGIDPAIVSEYFEQMLSGKFNKHIGVAGFKWEGEFFFNDGNHRMNAAIRYMLKTGDYKYMDILMENAKFDNLNPINYGKVYKFPVKPTR